jgi:hypothetical protein
LAIREAPENQYSGMVRGVSIAITMGMLRGVYLAIIIRLIVGISIAIIMGVT